MELSTLYQPGQTSQESFTVEGKHTAYHIGSGGSRVLSTPAMISFMEGVAHRLLSEKLPEGQLSVGIHVDVKHLAATPVGATVNVKVELLELEDRRARFQVAAWDEHEKIGEGEHERAVVDLDRFQQGVAQKRGTR